MICPRALNQALNVTFIILCGVGVFISPISVLLTVVFYSLLCTLPY